MKQINDNWADLLKIEEELTIQNTEAFKTAMAEFIQSPKKQLVLDLSGVNYINSSSLGTIAHSVMSARKAQKDLILCGVQASLEEIFEIVKFKSFMNLFPTIEEAKRYFEQEKIPHKLS